MRITLFAACLLLVASAGQAQPDASAEKFRRLVAGLPTQREQQECREILRQGETAANRKEFRAARQKTRRFWRRLPALFACIRQGSNVMEYPGLLALGPVWHGDNSGPGGSRVPAYSIHVGESLLGTETGSRPTDFVVDFDEKGVIRYVDDLICRQ